MDFSKLMNIASNNQQNAVNKVKNKKSKDDGSGQVSSAAVKAFLARQNAEKAKHKEQEEAAKRARIQARLQGKQLDKSKQKTKPEDASNEYVSQKPKDCIKNQNTPRSHASSGSASQRKLKHVTERKRTDDERKLLKPKEKEKSKTIPEQKTKHFEQKNPTVKDRKAARPTMSFQELMNVAKQQADNPDAFRNNTTILEQKLGSKKVILEKSLPNNRTMANGRGKETKTPEMNNTVSGKINRGKNVTTSQSKQSMETRKQNVPQASDKKQLEIHHRKQPENRHQKLPASPNRKVAGNRDQKFSGKPEVDVKPKVSEKPRTMTIESQTISQREYGSPMKHRGSKEHLNFQRKRRHNMYYEDDYDDDMDEFIDDSEDAPETISSYIKEIFGYDRRRFREEDDDVRNMESSFADIQREEAKSLRIAKLEDEVERLKESYEHQQQQRKKKKLKH